MKRWKRFTRKDSATVYALQNSLHKSCWSWQGNGCWKKKEQQWFITMIEGLHFFSHCMSVSSFFMTSFRDGMHGRKPTSKVFTLLSVFDDVHLHGGSLFFVKWKGGDRVKGLLNHPFAGDQTMQIYGNFEGFPLFGNDPWNTQRKVTVDSWKMEFNHSFVKICFHVSL